MAELLRQHPKRHELQRRGLRALRDLAYKGERVALPAVEYLCFLCNKGVTGIALRLTPT